MGMKNDEPKRPPKSILYYYGIVLIVLLLLNVLVFPSLTERQVTEVTYDQFLDMLDQGIVKGVYPELKQAYLKDDSQEAKHTFKYLLELQNKQKK